MVDKTITLSTPITLELTPQQVQVIVAGLQELPYKFSQPVLDVLYETCQAAQEKADA